MSDSIEIDFQEPLVVSTQVLLPPPVVVNDLMVGPRGPKGNPGSDASVTESSIIAALGFTPVSPAQMASVEDDALAYALAFA